MVDLGQGRLMALIGSGTTLGDLTRIAGNAELRPADVDWLDG